MKLPFIDRIWRVKGSLPLETPMTPATAFDKLDPLFQTNGTSYEIAGDTLTFAKKNPAAQDKLATFTRGTLKVGELDGRSVLSYNVTSPALLACFLAPLLFLALGQGNVAIGEYEKSKAEAAEKSGKNDKEKKPDEEDKDIELHWIDVALGAPAPEKPDEKDKEEDKYKKYSPKPAYILAAIFATLYLVGRILEPWLLRSIFRRNLSDRATTGDIDPGERLSQE
ncbi:hypothetical protein [Sphingorhabdus sp. YGSMI21]|uniref:hypothetical protein n=1 Tax=Sphingorhabdus sp. YGSMI21 TaxID=2077182 RepID=UPI000C1E34A1|nr:hypothetical protein [Sphingorhabdus sp. YGSMI21]ATW04615.1 hypothetical protein CHN51_14510 [Sphingorhabdus sp. YGSMI21]